MNYNIQVYLLKWVDLACATSKHLNLNRQPQFVQRYGFATGIKMKFDEIKYTGKFEIIVFLGNTFNE